MLDKDVKARIADYFEAWDLVDFLQVSIEDVINAFEDEIEESLDDVEELMGVRDEKETSQEA